MIRTQISLDPDEYRAAKDESRRQGVSIAEFVRRAVARSLGRRRRSGRPWMRHAGAVSSGDPEASARVNEVVYRRPRP
ncbi:MAG: CopG family transcriptional regulator [Candidatus Binatia bacterium]